MSLYDLLPPNSTQLERDFSRSVSFLPKLEGGPPVIRTAKRRNIPPSVLPWLVYEYGLGEVSQYFDDFNQLIIDGVAWQQIRGTPDSISQAVGWLGLNGTVDESEAGSYRWSEFQIGLEAATSEPIVRDVIYLARLSAPVRSRLNRVFAVYDFRRFVLDDSLLSEGAMLSDHSGTRPGWAGGTQISFGRVTDRDLSVGPTIAADFSRERYGVVALSDRFILDQSILGGIPLSDEPNLALLPFGAVAISAGIFDSRLEYNEAWHVPNQPVGIERERGGIVTVDGDVRGWTGVWDATTWAQPLASIVGGHV